MERGDLMEIACVLEPFPIGFNDKQQTSLDVFSLSILIGILSAGAPRAAISLERI
jgi:hypothetical protein